MKSFLSLFTDSFLEMKKIRTLTLTGLLIALALILKSLAIQVTPSVRIAFAFLAIMLIGMFFGPVISGMSGFLVDFLSFVFFDKTGQPYSPVLGIAFLLSGMIYGLFLYKKDFNFIAAYSARIISVIFCHLGLNSIIIYLSFVNPSFDITSSVEVAAFFIWFGPRLLKSAIQLVPDLILISIILPVARKAYEKVYKIKPVNA